MRQITLVRHGSTQLNKDPTQDKIRGWLDVPLDANGKKEAVKVGKDLKGEGFSHIVTSDFRRAAATAEEIKKTNPGAQLIKTPKLRPWNLGKFNGQASQKAHPEIQKYINDPDKKVPQGESFNSFKNRAFQGLHEAVNKHAGNVAIVTHHRIERLINAWKKAGETPDHSLDISEFDKRGQAPGTAKKMDINEAALSGVKEKPLAQLHPLMQGLFGSQGQGPSSTLGSEIPES